jgi:hypothetical protein
LHASSTSAFCFATLACHQDSPCHRDLMRSSFNGSKNILRFHPRILLCGFLEEPFCSHWRIIVNRIFNGWRFCELLQLK